MLSTAPPSIHRPHPARTEAGEQVGAAAWTLRLTGKLTVTHHWCKSVNESAAANSQEARGGGSVGAQPWGSRRRRRRRPAAVSMVQRAPWTGASSGLGDAVSSCGPDG